MDVDREGLSAIERALTQALDVELSPDFAARVRQRIAEESTRAPVWRAWWMVPAAAATLAVITVGGSVRSTSVPSTPRLLAARSMTVPQLHPGDVHPNRLLAGLQSPVAAARPRRTSVSAASRKELEVLVPREEIEMYRRVIAAAQKAPGAVVVEAPPVIVAGPFISQIVIDPIRIDPIVPPAGGEGERQ
jgi:hypothetical protein